MKYITNKDIESLEIKTDTLLDWVETTLLNKKNCYLPAKISMKFIEGHFYNVMPCIIPDQNVAGIKVVNRYPDNHPSLKSNLMLYDLATGDLKAIFEADWITTWRTAAVAVHSIKILARSDYKTIAFLGLGQVGKATLELYLKTLNNEKKIIRILNYHNIAKSIIEKFSNYKNIIFESYDNYEDMVSDCDVIVSAITYAEQDFAFPSCYKEGCLLVPIHTLGFQQCDLVFDKIIGDDYGHIETFKYFNQFKEFHEMSDVLLNKKLGRNNEYQRIIAYNVGISLHDITFAEKIYQLIKNNETK